MAKLTYWVASCKRDSSVYSIRAKTRKEVLKVLEEYNPQDYEAPVKETVIYDDAFDLLKLCLSEAQPL
jgi:hypothetical protein